MAVAVTLKLQPRSEHRKIMDWIDDLLERTLVLVAHPDDECIAFGALLQRMREPLVVFATDGSPADPYFWQKYGSREAYAVLRRKEALESMRAAGVKDVLFLADMPGGEKLVDQELFRNLHTAYDLLADAVARRMTPALLTLAYEGGHPDHDACSFLAAQLAQAEQERKREMCRAYLSQGDFLQKFDVSREIVRPQASYDFTRPPHEGKTNYEVWQWSMTAQEVSAAFAEFLRVAPKRPGKEQ
jgi:LmbE family N-acetylglucosaminyl deacetylase